MEELSLSVSKEDAEAILRHPDIFNTVSEDGMDAWEAPDGPIYLCGYIDVPIGCFVLHAHSTYIWECHVQVLPEYRHVYAVEFGKRVIEWAFANTQAERLIERRWPASQREIEIRRVSRGISHLVDDDLAGLQDGNDFRCR